VLKAVEARAPAARYAVVYKRFQNWTLSRLLPTRWLDRLLAAALHLGPTADADARKRQ